MKNSPTQKLRQAAFTLIELLVVIAIIAILAGLLIPVMGKVKQNMALKLAQAEMTRVQSAIEAYKSKLGHYPPDNTNNFARNQLYYELVGCSVVTNGTGYIFTPLDGSPSVDTGGFSLGTGGAVLGIVNSAPAGGGDEAGTAVPFLKELKPAQYGTSGFRLLGVKVDGPATFMAGELNPFRYNSSSPTNNPDGYDLWIDILFGKKTNRISNWRSGVFTP